MIKRRKRIDSSLKITNLKLKIVSLQKKVRELRALGKRQAISEQKKRYWKRVKKERGKRKEEGEIKLWMRRSAGSYRAKEFVALFCEYKLRGVPVDWEALGRIYRPDQEIPRATLLRLVRTNPLIFEMIVKRMTERLLGEGIDQKFIVDVVKDSIKLAKRNKQPQHMLAGAALLGKYIGLEKGTQEQNFHSLTSDAGARLASIAAKRSKLIEAPEDVEIIEEKE